ncbi:MAG: hypothetical protein STHCBS139747_001887 [Sporothrix thermara]
MIAPRQMYSPAAEESDPSLYLPQETVVSVQGISIPVPTRLLVHGSAYWAARVIEHAQACRSATMSRLPSLLTTPPPALPPIILDESTHGICFSAYEFTVYVSLLQAEEHLRVALALELPPPGPLHGPLFRSFVAAGMPMPSAQALDNVSRMAVFFGRTDLARRVPLPPQQMLPERLNRRPRDSSASSYMQTTTAQQQGHQQRQERQARQDLWNSQLNVCKNERAGTTATHVATHTSYDNVLAGLVPLTAPPSPSGWADCTMVETPFSSCSLEDDPVYLPPMRSPLPSGFYDPPPTPHLRHTPGLRPLAAMEPPLLPSPPSMHRLGLPPVASPLPVSTPPTTTPGFFPLLPLPPRVDASQERPRSHPPPPPPPTPRKHASQLSYTDNREYDQGGRKGGNAATCTAATSAARCDQAA